jgi:hypothetical protein
MKLFTVLEVHDAELGTKLKAKYVHVVAGDWHEAARIWSSFRIAGSENDMSLREAYIDWHSERTQVRCSFCHDEVMTLQAHEFWKAANLKPSWIDGTRVEPVWHEVAL